MSQGLFQTVLTGWCLQGGGASFVYCEVGTDFLNKIQANAVLHRVKPVM
jgi:hypothetical protein